MKSLVLIVSNTQEEIDSISILLNKEYDPISVLSGKEAISMYRSIHNTIRVVLLSLSISDMDGLDVLKKLKSISSKPEIIVYSNSNDPKIVIQSMKLGASDFVSLPINKSLLLDVLGKVVGAEKPLYRMEEDIKRQFLEKFEQKLNIVKELLKASVRNGEKVSTDKIKELLEDKKQELDITNDEKQGFLEIMREEEKTKRPTILIVEDDDLLRNSLHRMLCLSYKVNASEVGQKSLKILEESPDIDVVLLDIGLPDCNGVDLIPKIRHLNKDIEIVLLTAYKDFDYITKSFKGNAYEYIIKPVQREIVGKIISRALERKYNNKIFDSIGKKVLASYPENMKINILNDFAMQGKTLLMQDIYLFFPELKNCGLDPNMSVPKNFIELGILHLVDDLKTKIKKLS